MASEEGEASPKYQELVQGRADCASKIHKLQEKKCNITEWKVLLIVFSLFQ